MKKNLLLLRQGKWHKNILLLSCILMGSIGAFAQYNLSGTVVDNRGEPVIGASIQEKGTTNIVVTDQGGKFSLTVAAGAVLQVSHAGYTTREVVIGNQTNVRITLEQENQTLGEVVVIGYGTVKKKDLTGAVSVIKTELLRDRNSQDIVGAMQGLASGVKVTSSGLPGQQASIIIRGLGSLTNNAPLFIVDGMIGGGNFLILPMWNPYKY